jgi:O-antigen/teichoic acid export membrane protein
VSRGERFSRGVLWGLSGHLAGAVVALFVLPRLVLGFGEENYGVYLLMQAAAGWVMLMHFGAGMSAVKSLSEARATGRWGQARAALRLAVQVQLGGALAAGLALWLAAPALARLFDVPGPLAGHGVWLLRAAALAGVLGNAASLSAAALQGLQAYAPMSALAAAPGILAPLGAAAALAVGRGLGAAAASFVAVQALCALAGALLVRRHLPPAGPAELDRPAFLRYGMTFWPGAAAQFAAGQLDRVFVAGLRSLSDFTLYAVPVGLLQRAQTIPSVAGAVLLPMLGEAAAGSPGEVERLYLRCGRVLLVILAPFYLLLFALMPQFLSLWLGGRFGDAAVWPARLMVLAQGLAALAQMPATVAAARQGGVPASAAAWLQALLSLTLWPVLIPRYGLVGAAGGALLAQAAATALLLSVVHGRILRLSLGRFIREALAPAAVAALPLLALAWPLRTRISGWATFLCLVALCCAAYSAAAWRLLPAEDRDFLARRAKAAAGKLESA